MEINIDIINSKFVISQKQDLSWLPQNFKFKTKPFKHQLDGVKFALDNGKFLLCDDQGLGKTKQIIDWVSCLSIKEEIHKVLIICGVNSLKYNWKEEVKIHSDDGAWVLGTRYRKTTGKAYEGNTNYKLEDLDCLPDCKYIITNIETLRAGAKKVSSRKYSFPVAEKIQKLCEDGVFSIICADEIHKMKNPTSLQGRAFSLLQTKYMCALSGTPLMNKPLDLFVPLHWLGVENHSYWQFCHYYGIYGGYAGSELVGYRNLDNLRSMVESVMIRRLKTDVLDLPDKIRKIEFVDMKPKQSRIYKEIQNKIKSELQKVKFSNNPLSMLIRLRQATGWTGLVSDVVSESAKMDRMVELVDEIVKGDGKVIVFSNWSAVTDIAKTLLSKYNPAYITGNTKTEDRMLEVNKFQNNTECKVIIGTIGAMGTGLTLTAAQNVIFLDSPWNMALKAQAEDRAHRIGTKGTVNITTLVCKNTIDERIEQLVKRKGKMSEAIIDGKISNDDIDFLIS